MRDGGTLLRPHANQCGLLTCSSPHLALQDKGPSVVSPVVIFGHAIASLVQNGVAVNPLHAVTNGNATATRQWHRASVLPASSSALRREDRTGASQPAMSAESITARRQALLALLASRRIPVSEASPSELLVLGVLRVAAPYTAETCTCENEIVLGRFCTILAELDGSSLDGGGGDSPG